MTEPTDVPTKRTSRRRQPQAAIAAPPLEAPTVEAPEVSHLPPPMDSPAVAPPPMPPPMPPRRPAPPTAPEPPPEEPTLPNSAFRRHDVVQVLDPNSSHYGQFFMVGDVLRRKVHGYCLTEGRHKDYITIDVDHCWYIGPSKIRSAQPCSPKWLADNRPS